MDQVKNNRVAYAAMIVMSSMIVSRLTGFIRETMLSWKVGLSWVQDAYVAAFTVPDLMYTLLVGGTISAALVPFLSGHLEKGEVKEGWRAASSFINVIFLLTAAFCAAGIIFAPQIIPAVAPGFSDKSPEMKELSIRLMRILFPSVSFIMLAGICNGILNSYRKFAAAAYGPSIYNTGCALSIFLFADRTPESMVKVATGVAASAVLYFLVQLAASLSEFKLYKPFIYLSDKGFQKLFGQAVPSLLSSSVTQVNVIISTAFVSLTFAEGSLAAFRNANTAWQLPYGIFAMGIGTAILPALSGKFAAGELEHYKSILMKSLTSVLFLAIPSAVGFFVLREPVVRAIFKWGGRFTEENVPVVAYILGFFTIAMIAQSIVAIMNRAFYALQDTRTPLLTGILTLLLNLLFGTVFHRFTNLGAAGMALSYSIISTVNSILLLILLKRKMNGVDLGRLARFLLQSGLSAAAMGAILYLLEVLPLPSGSKAVQLMVLAVEIAAGVLVYLLMMLLLKNEDAQALVKRLKQGFHGRKS